MHEQQGYETAQIERRRPAPKRWPRKSEAASPRGCHAAQQKYCRAPVAAQPDEARCQLKQDQPVLDQWSCCLRCSLYLRSKVLIRFSIIPVPRRRRSYFLLDGSPSRTVDKDRSRG